MTSIFSDHEDARISELHSLGVLDTPPEDIYDDIVLLAASICGAPIAAVTLIDTERQWFKSVLGLDMTETSREAAFCDHTIRHTDLFIVDDAQNNARFAANPLVTGDPNVRFYAGAPLITSAGYALGSLCVIDREPRQLSSQQKAALRVLARQVTSQLEASRRAALEKRLNDERRKAEEAVRRSEARLVEAQRVAHIGSWEFDLATQEITWSQEMFRLIGRDPAYGEPSVEELMNYYHPDDVPMHIDYVNQAILDGEPHEFDIRILSDDGATRWGHVMGRGERDENGQVVRLFGTVMDTTDRKLDEENIRDYSIVLECSLAELNEANTRLESLATTDGLTGLKNHRAFQERLAEEFQRASRYGSSLSLLILDVDYFKRFNDTFGHPAGDAVLKEVGDLLQVTVREVDTVARHGGEEFAVILPLTDSLGALAIAERLRQVVEQTSWIHQNVTVSIGVSSLRPGMTDHSILIDSADKALHQAKRGGRNQITYFEALPYIVAASLS